MWTAERQQGTPGRSIKFEPLESANTWIDGEKMEKIYDGKKPLKLGTEKNPAFVHVKTKIRLKEVASIFEEHGWHYKIELEPDKPENINDLEILLNHQKRL